MARSSRNPYGDSFEPTGMPQLALPRLTRAVRRLLIVLAAIYAGSFLVYLASTETWNEVVGVLGLRGAAWVESFPLVPIWQLLTHGFLHSVRDPFHLLYNLLVLYFFGTMLEEILGTRRFVVAYFSAQLAGALVFLVPGALRGDPTPAIGASGAVYGVMVAMATLRPHQRVLFLFIPVTLRTMALVFLGITVFGAALQWKDEGGGGVAHLVHLGGIAYGYLAVKSKLIFADPLQALARARASRDAARRQSDEARVDHLLEKINREGMGALSKSEREFLKRVSSRR